MLIKVLLIAALVSALASALMSALKLDGLLHARWFWVLLPAGAALALCVVLLVPILVAARIILHEGRNIP